MNVLGWILLTLAAVLLIPAGVDWFAGSESYGAFLLSATLLGLIGAGFTLSTSGRRSGRSRNFKAREAFLLTFGIWAVVPLGGAIPFMLAPPQLPFLDAYFEAVSGITTTGSTVITGLDALPTGVNLWRGMLNWLGGLGIAFVAMIFLPVMRVGGMQFFRTEGFDTFGKVLPRATDIARDLVAVYAALTLAAILVYEALGQEPLDAVVHGMASIATGGFSPNDSSFNPYRGANEYAGILFMFLGALPYIRFIQLAQGQPRALRHDPQVRAFARIVLLATLLVTFWRVTTTGAAIEPTFREALFNLLSIMTTTGFFTGDFGTWGGLALVVALILGFIGGCSGSSSAALSVFRVQLIDRAIRRRIQLIHAPSRIVPIRYDGQTVHRDVIDGLMLYSTGYIVTVGVIAALISLTGADFTSALFASWLSVGNIGYGFGPMITRTGTFVEFSDTAKWLMILAMIMGRLGLLTVFVMVLPRFWRD